MSRAVKSKYGVRLDATGKAARTVDGQYASTQSLADRFWSHVDKSGDCWLWTGGQQRHGYGMFGIKRTPPGAKIGAHRMAYILTHGPISRSVHVCHKCDVPLCVRPDHLWLGSPLDNIRDAVQKGRTARGVKQHNSKLTDESVKQIRELRASGIMPGQLAANFGVSVSLIHYIVGRKIWRHV